VAASTGYASCITHPSYASLATGVPGELTSHCEMLVVYRRHKRKGGPGSSTHRPIDLDCKPLADKFADEEEVELSPVAQAHGRSRNGLASSAIAHGSGGGSSAAGQRGGTSTADFNSHSHNQPTSLSTPRRAAVAPLAASRSRNPATSRCSHAAHFGRPRFPLPARRAVT